MQVVGVLAWKEREREKERASSTTFVRQALSVEELNARKKQGEGNAAALSLESGNEQFWRRYRYYGAWRNEWYRQARYIGR